MFDILDLCSTESQDEEAPVSEKLSYATVYFAYYPYLIG